MNYKKFSAVVFAVFMIGSALPTLAQKSKAAGDDAAGTVGIAERKLDSATFRVVVTTEWFDRKDGDVVRSYKETFAQAPDRYQTIAEIGSSRIETIVIEDKTFRKNNDEEWESVAVAPIKKAGSPEMAARFGAYEGGSHTPLGNGKFVARGTIDGQEVTQYETRKVLADSNPDGMTRVETTNVWINRDGMIVRKITEHEQSGTSSFMRATSNYVYGDIRIVAPEVPTGIK